MPEESRSFRAGKPALFTNRVSGSRRYATYLRSGTGALRFPALPLVALVSLPDFLSGRAYAMHAARAGRYTRCGSRIHVITRCGATAAGC